MRLLQDDDEEVYKRQFSHFIKNGISPDGVEEMYKKCHAAIRADPEAKPKTKKDVKTKRWNKAKRTLAQRQDRVMQIKKSYLKKQAEADD
jgi:large subunit ribosomal protein L5e